MKIQCFEIDVRAEEGIDEVLKIIDRAITYLILFQLTPGKFKKGIISKKYPNPTRNHKTTWSTEPGEIQFDLRKSLDEVSKKLCTAVSGEKVAIRIDIDPLVSVKKALSGFSQDSLESCSLTDT